MLNKFVAHTSTFACAWGAILSPQAFAQESNSAQTQEAPAQPQESKPTPSTSAAEQPSTSTSADENAPIQKQTKIKENVTKKSNTEKLGGQISGTGLGIFGSAELGVVFSVPTDVNYKQIETSQLGIAPVLKFGASTFTRRIILDFGLGIQYAKFGGTISALPSVDEDSNIVFIPLNEKYTNTQVSMLVEAAGRLRIKQKYQVGLLAQVLVSGESAGFSSLPNFERPQEKFAALLGPQFVYEGELKDKISRLTGSFTMSLTGNNRTVYLASLGASLGAFLINPVTVVKTKSTTRTQTKVTRETIQLKAQRADVTDNISFIFDSQMINFKLNSAEINPKSAGFLSALGEIFARERDIWSKLMIEGHTDSRGSAEYNIKLSTMRARSVLDTLEKAGVARESMEAVGLGSTQMLVNPEVSEIDYARNRRVEIRILGLKDSRALKKYVDEVQERFFGKPAETRSVPIPKPSVPSGSGTPGAPAWDPGLEAQ
ncbi:MAG: OmpA family protein [Silvanigrellaceae bacterium]